MTTIHITRPHQLSHEAARAVAGEVAVELEQEFGLQHAWEGEILRFHTFGVRGELHVGDADITLEAHLGAFFSPFQQSLEREIHRHFDKHLQTASPSAQQAA